MNILVSACLLGMNCRYCGTGCAQERVVRLAQKHCLIPICPEQAGGLSTPRDPVEITAGRALTSSGKDCTAQFEKGAAEAARLAALLGCGAAVLKSRSPSCGCGMIYDGTFRGRLTPGNGFAAQKLMQQGVSVFTEEECEKIPDE